MSRWNIMIPIYFEDPFVKPAHFFRNHDVGGDFSLKVKDRLEKADRTTGIGVSFTKPFVTSLNCLQNSAIFTPRGPKA